MLCDLEAEFMEVLGESINPFDKEEVADSAYSLGYDELGEFCEDVSEDVYLLHAQEWYDE